MTRPSPSRSIRTAVRARFLACALALAATPLAARADDGPTPPAPAPAPVAPPAPDAGPVGITDEAKRKAILAIVDALRDEAAKLRGLAWKFAVPADVISRAEMRKDFERQVKEELKPELYDRDVKLARRLGVLGADEDPIAMTLSFMERGVAGYYDPKRRHFYVIDGLSGDAQRPTILHELIHALEDQYIDLKKTTEAVEDDADKLFALKCVQEGSAEHARKLYQRAHPDVARLAAMEQAKSPDALAMMKAITAVPSFLVVSTLLNYQTGPAFVGRAVGKDYVAGMAKLYAEPPQTQEQVLHPGKFLATDRDLPQRIVWPDGLAALLGTGWKAAKSSAVGELDVALWFDHWLGGTKGRLTQQLLASGRYWSKDAETAALGWDGGVLQVLERDGKPQAVVGILAWDSAKDANEAADALRLCLERQHGDAWKDGAWTTTSGGGRTATYTGRFGAGRLEVAGDVVRLLDGVPADALEQTFAALAGAKVERVAGDTWTPAAEPDVFAAASWVSAKGKEAWTAPGEGWTVAKDGAAGVATKGALTVRLETVDGPTQLAFARAVGMLGSRHPGAALDVSAVEELMVESKGSARVRMDDRKGDAPHARWIYVVPNGDHILLITLEAPKAEFAGLEGAMDDALEGLGFRD